MRTPVVALLFPLLCACGDAGPKGDKGPTGPAGKQGPAGTGGPPTLVLVTPPLTPAARSATLLISGINTHFSKGNTTVDFGDAEIKPGAVTVGSLYALSVPIQITDKVKLGSKDLTVTTKNGGGTGVDEKVTLAGALSVQPNLSADATGNTQKGAQGGLLDFSVNSLDAVQYPFSLTQPPKVTGAFKLISLQTNAAKLTGTLLVDPTAAVGGVGMKVTGTDGGTGAVSFLLDPLDPGAPQVQARAATTLTLGTGKSGEQIPAPGAQGQKASALYKLTTAGADQVVQISLTQMGTDFGSVALGAVSAVGGRFGDGQVFYAIGSNNSASTLGYLPTAGDYYVALMNFGYTGGTAGAGYNILAKTAAGKTFPTKEPSTPDVANNPLANVTLDAAYFSTDGAIDKAGDVDYIKVAATKTGALNAYAGSVDLGLGVGVPITVNILSADCTTASGSPLGVNKSIQATAGTTYCVSLSAPAAQTYPIPYTLVLSHDL